MKPSAPSFSVDSFTQHEARVSVTPPTQKGCCGSLTYLLKWRNAMTPTNPFYPMTVANVTQQQTITSLEPGQLYSVIVTATNSAGSTDSSAKLLITLQAGKCSTPPSFIGFVPVKVFVSLVLFLRFCFHCRTFFTSDQTSVQVLPRLLLSL